MPSFCLSLCKLFGEVPLLKSPTTEYEILFTEALDKLWKLVTDSDSAPIISSALRALRNFNFAELTLKHFPALFYADIQISSEYKRMIAASESDPEREGDPLTVADVVPYIPGECWVELISKVNQNAVDAAVDLAIHVVEEEVSQYRSGVYMLSEGRAEPNELQHLHNRSPLRAIVKFLAAQAKSVSESRVVVQCLQCIAHKYSRPIPPLNWFFLTGFITGNCDDPSDQFNMRKLALTIAANQIAHSGSAKNLVESFVQEFDVATKSSEEIETVAELLPSIVNGVSSRLFAAFLEKIVAHLLSTINGRDNDLLDKCLAGVSKVFSHKCLAPENLDIVIDELSKCYQGIDADHKVLSLLHLNLFPLPEQD